MMHAPPPALLIPETAPFSPEQRAWLTGYFSALLAPDANGMPVPLGDGVALPGGEPAAPLADSGDAPWHDPSLPLDDRMKMAEARPLAPRLMAAMAQRDCG